MHQQRRIFISAIVFSLIWLSKAYAHTPVPSEDEMSDAKLAQILKKNNVKSLDQLIPYLPGEMRPNFVLKHWIKQKGERGHLVEEKICQSADPCLPRAILWDERNG